MARLSRRPVLAALVLLALAPALPAQTLTWDPTHVPASPAGGAGTWTADAVTPPFNWSNGTADVPWPNNATTAVFGGTAGAVAIDPAGVTAGGLTFNTSGYTIGAVGTGNGPLTLTSAATITNAVTATINAQVLGSGTLVKTGIGDLLFNNPANAFSHVLTVTGGGRINSSGLTTGGTPFGTGSIVFDDSSLRASLATGVGAVNLTAASGPGGTLTFAAGSNLIFNRNQGTNTLTMTIGDPAAASSSLVRSGRGVLSIATTTAIGSAATGTERVFVNGGVPTVSPGGTNPNTYAPAYFNSILSSGGTIAADFLTYNPTDGFKIATYTSTDITTAAATDVVNQTVAATLAGPAQAFGLKTTQPLNLNGNTLTLGNGSGTAGLYLSSASPATSPALAGPGTIAFGGAEGLIFIPGNTPITGDITITGTNGVTMFTSANVGNPRGIVRGNLTVTTDFTAQMGIIIAETNTTSGPATGVLKVGTPTAPAAFVANSGATLATNPGFIYIGFRNGSATGNNSNGTLDLADATAVTMTATNIHVGRSTSQTGTGAATGALLLPTSTTAPVSLTASAVVAVGGDNQSSPESNGLPTPQITLAAGSTVMTTPFLKIGGFNTGATVAFRPVGGKLTLTGPNGTATDVTIADNSIGTTAATFTANASLDLTGGRLTANVGTLLLGFGNAAGTGGATGTLTIDGATSAAIINTAALGNVRGTGAADGSLIVKNGNVTINALALTSQSGTGAASATLRLTNDGTNANTGTVTLNGPIVTTSGTGTGTRTTTVDLLDGTLNMQNNDVGDVTNFNFSGGTLRNPGTITRSAVAFSQTGGTLLRNAAGTTTIAGGAYNLTAPALAGVSAGTLLANGSVGSAPGTGTVAVTGAGALGGNGTINGNVVISSVTTAPGGTLSPGNSIGTLTLGSGTMTWNPGGSYLFEHNVQATSPAAPGTDNDTVASAGALDLSHLTAGSFTINLVPTNLPASQTTFGQVQYTLGTFAGGVNGSGGPI
ncbi:MAG TPA: hypothetical protein VGF55_28070, partial [Gemmataceae bacterium]